MTQFIRSGNGKLVRGANSKFVPHAATLSLDLRPTFDCIGLRATFTGSVYDTTSATVQFRVVAGSWKNAYAPCVDRRTTVNGSANPYLNQYRGSIVGLSAGTTYEVQVDIKNGAGVTSATASGFVTTLASTPTLGGGDWYVDDVGVNGSGSSGSPFNSIASALAAASPGDTIHLRPGTYAPFTVSVSGTSSGWIAIVGDDRDTCIISGGAVTNNVTVDGNYIQLKNLRFAQTQHNSIELATDRHHVWIENTYHEDVSSTQTYNDAGISLLNGGHHHVYILNNTILSPTATAAAVEGNRWDEPVCAVYIGTLDSSGVLVIKGNTITGGFRDGIGNSPESTGNYLNDVDIANNTISGVKDDPIQTEGDSVNVRIWGNMLDADNGMAGIGLESAFVGPVYVFRNLIDLSWAGGSGGGAALKAGGAANLFVFHNTIRTDGDPHDCWSADGAVNLVSRNNIVVTKGNPIYRVGPTADFDYDVYYRPGGGYIVSQWNNGTTYNDYATVAALTAGEGQEAHGVGHNPLFRDAALTIGPDSPAFGAGVALANFNDADSAWPAVGIGPDCGYAESAIVSSIQVVGTLYEGSSNTSGFTTAGAINTTGATTIVVGVGTYSGDVAATLSDDKGNVYGAATITQTASGCGRLQVWVIDNPTVGAGHHWTIGGGCYAPSIAVIALKTTNTAGSLTGTPTSASASTGTSLQPGTVTPGEDNCMVLTFYASNGDQAYTPEPLNGIDGQVAPTGNHVTVAIAYEIQTTATPRNPTWTLASSGGKSVACLAIKKG